VYDMLSYLTVLSCLYFLLAVYWGIVFVGGPGTQRSYFFIQPSYWMGQKANSFGGSEDSSPGAEVDAEAGEQRSFPPRDAAIKIMSLKKVYKDVIAVNDVTLSRNRGEVTALLGHNSAG
jgi:hypothetical protein